MSYNPMPYDGDMTLESLEEKCEMEQIKGLQLTDIKYSAKIHNGKVFPVNKATYEEKTFGKLRNLSFTEAASDDEAKQIKEKLESEGWTYIQDTHVYAGKDGQTRLIRVIVAGKKTF